MVFLIEHKQHFHEVIFWENGIARGDKVIKSKVEVENLIGLTKSSNLRRLTP